MTPNTLVRLAQSVGLDGFESLRRPFREETRRGPMSPLERPAWLEAIAEGSPRGAIVASVAEAALDNLERLFADADVRQLETVARRFLDARSAYVLGVGTLAPAAKLFAALARPALDTIRATPTDSSLPLDDLAHAGPQDLLLAMTFRPYRRETVEAVRQAARQGVPVVALTDSWSSPIVPSSTEVVIVPAQTPQLYVSVVSIAALLELLLALIIREGGDVVAQRIRQFHETRFASGAYWDG